MKFERMVSKIYFKFLIHTRCFLVRESKIYLFLYFYNNEYVDCDICFNGKYLKIYIFLRINFFDIFLLTCIPCVINHADFIWNCSNEYSTVLRFKITNFFSFVFTILEFARRSWENEFIGKINTITPSTVLFLIVDYQFIIKKNLINLSLLFIYFF